MPNSKIAFLPGVAFLILCLSIVSCDKIMPSGFWKNFCTSEIVAESSNQGLSGGLRTIVWQSKTSGYFNKSKIISFAHSNGWIFVDSSFYFSYNNNCWYQNDTKIQPPFESSIVYKWIDSDMKILRFDSKMTIENPPGSAKFKTAYGYVFTNFAKTKMIMFETWGE